MENVPNKQRWVLRSVFSNLQLISWLSRISVAGSLLLVFSLNASASIIWTNRPAQAVTLARISVLPAREQPAWQRYLERSEHQGAADREFFAAELRAHGLHQTTSPTEDKGVRSIPLNQPASWYKGAEARRIADIMVSFQTPAGGWSKNIELTQHVRAPGERFAPDNASRFLGPRDYDIPPDTNWNYVGTIDNDATTTELRYLARVITATDPRENAVYRAAFRHGLDYLFAAQYPNGGWPQVWPLQGGYHDAITYNDDAMVNVLRLLCDVQLGKHEFKFVPPDMRQRATASIERGIECILQTQIFVAGRCTVWCQQHDALTLEPVSARNYEMPCQTSSESAEIVQFLMELPKPGSSVVAAVRAAVAWFEKTQIRDVAYRPGTDGARHLVHSPGSGPLWARYYEIETDRPIFGDRDKTIHDKLEDLSLERRKGYGWYRDTPARVLQVFARWSRKHPDVGLPSSKTHP